MHNDVPTSFKVWWFLHFSMAEKTVGWLAFKRQKIYAKLWPYQPHISSIEPKWEDGQGVFGKCNAETLQVSSEYSSKSVLTCVFDARFVFRGILWSELTSLPTGCLSVFLHILYLLLFHMHCGTVWVSHSIDCTVVLIPLMAKKVVSQAQNYTWYCIEKMLFQQKCFFKNNNNTFCSCLTTPMWL